MVDADKVRQKIAILEQNLEKLKVLQKLQEDDFLDDFRNVESTKHLLQVCVEIMINISDHIVARQRLGTPETSADGFRILAENGYLNKDNIVTYVAMTKFRNRVVHLYNEIDEKEIYKILQNNLKDFKQFLKEIINTVIIGT